MPEDRPSTPLPVEPPFRELFDRLERIHAENKQFRDTQMQTNVAIDKRVLELEFLDKQKEKRMNDGAQTFSKLEAQIERVNNKIDWPWWKVLATVSPAILLIITWVWQLSRYPDDTKFEALKSEVYELKLQQVKFDGKLSNIQDSQVELGKKIDDLRSRP